MKRYSLVFVLALFAFTSIVSCSKKTDNNEKNNTETKKDDEKENKEDEAPVENKEENVTSVVGQWTVDVDKTMEAVIKGLEEEFSKEELEANMDDIMSRKADFEGKEFEFTEGGEMSSYMTNGKYTIKDGENIEVVNDEKGLTTNIGYRFEGKYLVIVMDDTFYCVKK